MPIEIEHKYLVADSSYKSLASEVHHISQGYISTVKERTVRVRTYDDKGYITVKGSVVGATRPEFEYEIPLADAEDMLRNICEQPIIQKDRYIVPFGGNKWEVDEFGSNLKGLIVAEIEIPNEDYAYSLPPFAGKNVTGDPRYYNSNLASATELPK